MNVENLPQDRLINELYVWVIVDPKTNLESICAMHIGESPIVQAAMSSRTTALLMRDIVGEIASASGKRAKLVRFTHKETIQELKGNP